MKPLFYSILLLLVGKSALAQTGTIQGSIKDKSNKPVVHASVIVEKTYLGTSTDGSGQYSITMPVGSYTIRISAIGFKSIEQLVEVKSGETVEVNFETEEKVELLNEVEVRGIKTITGMGYLDEDHDGVIFSGKKTEVLLLDSLRSASA